MNDGHFSTFILNFMDKCTKIDDDSIKSILTATNLDKVIDDKDYDKIKSELEKSKQLLVDYNEFSETEMEKLKAQVKAEKGRDINLSDCKDLFAIQGKKWNLYQNSISKLFDVFRTISDKYDVNESLEICESEKISANEEPLKTINSVLYSGYHGENKDKSEQEMLGLLYARLLEIYPDYDKDNDKPKNGLLGKAILWMFNMDAKDGEPNNRLYTMCKIHFPDLLRQNRKIQSAIDSRRGGFEMFDIIAKVCDKTEEFALKISKIVNK